jgi:hypothetical protein
MCSQHLGEDDSSLMVNRMPEPSLLGFLPNKTPHFIDFCFFHLVDLNNDLTWIDVLNGRGIDVLELILFFLILQ